MNKKEDFTDPRLLAPFKLLTTVSRYECSLCGDVSEIPLNSAQAFIRVMGMLGVFPEVILTGEQDFKNYYFKISYCRTCRNYNKNKKTELKIELKVLKQELK